MGHISKLLPPDLRERIAGAAPLSYYRSRVVFVGHAREAYALDTAASVCEHHRDLELGLADASTFVLADRWRTTALATFDERHSRAILPLGGGAFELLPADAS